MKLFVPPTKFSELKMHLNVIKMAGKLTSEFHPGPKEEQKALKFSSNHHTRPPNINLNETTIKRNRQKTNDIQPIRKSMHEHVQGL